MPSFLAELADDLRQELAAANSDYNEVASRLSTLLEQARRENINQAVMRTLIENNQYFTFNKTKDAKDNFQKRKEDLLKAVNTIMDEDFLNEQATTLPKPNATTPVAINFATPIPEPAFVSIAKLKQSFQSLHESYDRLKNLTPNDTAVFRQVKLKIQDLFAMYEACINHGIRPKNDDEQDTLDTVGQTIKALKSDAMNYATSPSHTDTPIRKAVREGVFEYQEKSNPQTHSYMSVESDDESDGFDDTESLFDEEPLNARSPKIEFVTDSSAPYMRAENIEHSILVDSLVNAYGREAIKEHYDPSGTLVMITIARPDNKQEFKNGLNAFEFELMGHDVEANFNPSDIEKFTEATYKDTQHLPTPTHAEMTNFPPPPKRPANEDQTPPAPPVSEHEITNDELEARLERLRRN